MLRVLLVFQTEGMAYVGRDLAAFDMEVESVGIAAAEDALLKRSVDAIVVEAGADLEQARSLLDSPGRTGKVALLALLRPEQLIGLDPGWPADDIAVLPARPEEVAARLRRIAWRKSGLDVANTIRSGSLLLDLANYKVFVADLAVTLTFKEFELLRFLMTNRGKVFTREALLNRVWGYEYFGGARTVDVHIRRLRSKIETGSTVYIETVRNVGYRFPADL